jgi:hypothetical protein
MCCILHARLMSLGVKTDEGWFPLLVNYHQRAALRRALNESPPTDITRCNNDNNEPQDLHYYSFRAF